MGFFASKRVSIRVLITVVCLSWVLAIGGGQLLAGSDDTYKGLKLFSDVIDLIEKNYVDPVDPEKLIEGALQGMISSLDPHSSFLPPDAFKELQIDTHGEFGGIGIVIAMKDGLVTVVAPIEGTPADRAGIKAGDNILKVDGKATKDLKLWESVQKMRGPKGSKVVLTIFRKGFKEPKDFTLVRDIIPIESVYHVMLEQGYGYVRVTNFRDNTTQDLEAALNDMESQKQPLKGIILDLRNNPGGLMNQAISVADIFLDKGDIVSIKGRKKLNTKVYSATKNKKKRDYPMVVLINSGSASASEIVAGALQDHKRALLVGSATFGKGSVQTVEPLRNGYGIKLTIARYYTPNGRSIQAEGIIPDIVMSSGYDDGKSPKKDRGITEKDLQNHLAPEITDKQAPAGDKVQEPASTPDEEQGEEDFKEKYGTLTPEKILKDLQISRALEILKGHIILSETGS